MAERLLIIGNPEIMHIGAQFKKGAEVLGYEASICNMRKAYDAPRVIAKLAWITGHYPVKLNKFGKDVIRTAVAFRPKWILATGIAPIERGALQELKTLGAHLFNYLTDDPWNRAHYARWFEQALPMYDTVFSTKKAVIKDLVSAGCRNVAYLPFGYDPDLFHPVSLTEEEKKRYDSDVLFYGGADKDRIPYIRALISAGFRVALYGGYWSRHAGTRKHALGHADADTLRKAIAGTKVALCLVRRSNRDDNAMRTFEIPAVGACMLTEDTEYHREAFGEENRSVRYFKTVDEMVRKTRALLGDDRERSRLAQEAHTLITKGKNTYKDRLATMLKC